MSIESDIRTLLQYPLDDNAATGLGSRIYPDLLPQDVAYPAATYEVNSLNFEICHDGDAGLDLCEVTLRIYSQARSTLSTAAGAIWDTVHLFKGNEYDSDGTTVTLTENYRLIVLRFGQTFYDIDTKTWSMDIDMDIHRRRPSSPGGIILDFWGNAIRES